MPGPGPLTDPYMGLLTKDQNPFRVEESFCSLMSSSVPLQGGSNSAQECNCFITANTSNAFWTF